MNKPSTSREDRPRLQIGLFSAVFIASLIAAAASWLLVLPVRAPLHLTAPSPRPELLDKPHRHQAHVAVPATSALGK